MKRVFRQLWLLYNIDPVIAQDCPRPTRLRLAGIGIILGIVFCISFFSCGYLAWLITENLIASLFIGWILGWNFINLYRLILSTITTNPEKSRTGIGMVFSSALRVFFLVALVIMIIKPLELLYLYPYINPYLEAFKKEKAGQLGEKELQFIDEAIQQNNDNITGYKKQIRKEEKLIAGFSDPATVSLYQSSIDQLNVRIKSAEELNSKYQLMKEEYLTSYRQVSDDSNYIARRFQILLTRFPESWLITLLLGFMMTFPILVKLFTRKTSPYYREEEAQHKVLVLNSYQVFKENYTRQLEAATGLAITYFEPFIDAPFNTQPIPKEIECENQAEFWNWSKIYQE